MLWEDNKAAIIVAEGETSSVGRTKHVLFRRATFLRKTHLHPSLLLEVEEEERFIRSNCNERGGLRARPRYAGVEDDEEAEKEEEEESSSEEEEEEKEEEDLFKANAVN